MTVAIKRQNGDLIWFDAILQFGRTYSASVTKHPLEKGGLITDHTTIENPIISLSGIISDADFNLQRPIISESNAETYNITKKQFVNDSPVNSRPEISLEPSISRFLPESFSQLVGVESPVVVVPAADKPVQAAYIERILNTMWEFREEFELLDFEGSTISQIYVQCIITNLNFEETPDSGSALYPVMTIERVRYAESANVKIPQRVQDKIKGQSAPVQNKGGQSGNSTTKPTLPTDDPKTNPTNNTKVDASVLKGG